MKTNTRQTVSLSILAAISIVLLSGTASAQYPLPEYRKVTEYRVVSPPVAYTSVRPEVVGYRFQRRGLLGLRSEWQPVVKPVKRTVVARPTPVYEKVVEVREVAPLRKVTRLEPVRTTRMEPVTRMETVTSTELKPVTRMERVTTTRREPVTRMESVTSTELKPVTRMEPVPRERVEVRRVEYVKSSRY